MVKTARTCYSLALLACTSSISVRAATAFVASSRSYSRTTRVTSRITSRITTAPTTAAAMSAEEATSASATVNVAFNLQEVRDRMQACLEENDNLETTKLVQLVAVSKTKPNELLMEAYNAGQRVFGENYVQELVGKASELPADIKWHFIGSLQSNKANLLVKSVPNLCVETVATLKLANKLNRAVEQHHLELNDGEQHQQLDIFVQVNTSGEESKSGVEPGEDTIALCREILSSCPLLNIKGLMTIGAPGDDSCFDSLVKCRNEVTDALEFSSLLDLSMGMSGDYEEAMKHGATSIRVGSTIFGARDYSKLTK